MTRIAINGLGRIGRCVARAIAENNHPDLELVAMNGTATTDVHLHLLKYDSAHGIFSAAKKAGDNAIDLGFGPIPLYRERDPAALPWKTLDVDIVLECTGKFKTHKDASKHIEAGAKNVLISAPSADADQMIVYGVNNDMLSKDDHIVSVGSCTTNCLAPLAKLLDDTIGIEHGFMTTIHAYTSDQNILDNNHKDLRRARSCALSMIPTSTGAAKAIGKVLPNLAGKIDGVAVRVPTPNVSMVDFTFTPKKNLSTEEINQIIKQAAGGNFKGIIDYVDAPLVSIDFNHNPHSCIFDASGSYIVNNGLCRVAAWYDNEWGFSMRMLDVASLMGNL